MRRFSDLSGLRIGCVKYLNAKPLIAPYVEAGGEVIFAHPGCLADLLASGELDLALVPAFEALRQPELPIVDKVAIASKGEVYSVFLAYRGELGEIRRVLLDPASRTSNALIRCILAEFYGFSPEYVKDAAPPALADELPTPETAILLIGNQAIRYREVERPGVHYLDLGAEWLARTDLPFVYAAWQIRAGLTGSADVTRIASELRAIAAAGVARVTELAEGQKDFPAQFARWYLTHCIHFELGDQEKAGLQKYRSLLGITGLLDNTGVKLTFV